MCDCDLQSLEIAKKCSKSLERACNFNKLQFFTRHNFDLKADFDNFKMVFEIIQPIFALINCLILESSEWHKIITATKFIRNIIGYAKRNESEAIHVT